MESTESIDTSLSEPLDLHSRQIRLLSLQKGEWEDEIVCTLSNANLDDNPSYCALSYTWGDATVTKRITINGHLHELRLNLHNALRRLRAYGLASPIWIDAVCINQRDIDELTNQVDLMHDIYSNMDEVYISLGEAEALPIGNVQSSMKSTRPVTWYSDDKDLGFLNFFREVTVEPSRY
jgi:hypothetical protein